MIPVPQTVGKTLTSWKNLKNPKISSQVHVLKCQHCSDFECSEYTRALTLENFNSREPDHRVHYRGTVLRSRTRVMMGPKNIFFLHGNSHTGFFARHPPKRGSIKCVSQPETVSVPVCVLAYVIGNAATLRRTNTRTLPLSRRSKRRAMLETARYKISSCWLCPCLEARLAV